MEALLPLRKNMEKKDIRKKILALRESLPDAEAKEKSEKICEWLYKMECLRQAEVVYGYMPIRKEADIRPLLKRVLNEGKKLALPRVCGDRMDFYQITSFRDLAEGSFHVMEPKEYCKKVEEEGLVLVPGVVFDKRGGRIGYGKGYYDKYFAVHSHKLQKIGIGYTIQIIDTIPTTSLDVPLNGLASEEDIWMFA